MKLPDVFSRWTDRWLKESIVSAERSEQDGLGASTSVHSPKEIVGATLCSLETVIEGPVKLAALTRRCVNLSQSQDPR